MSDFQVMITVGGSAQAEPAASLVDSLAEETVLSCYHAESLDALENLLENTLPDLILLMADALTTEPVLEYCADLRERPMAYRPVLVVLSPDDEQHRLDYLMQGADDVLSSDLSLSELKIRLLVHLRRNLDLMANVITRLPNTALTARVAQRRMNRSEPWALMLIGINHFEVYREVYGDLPVHQVLKTFAALLARSVLVPDFVGQTEGDEFLILTHPDKAAKLAGLLCRQFEAAAPNFYSEKDRKQGYIISVVDDRISRRIPLLSLAIGIVTSKTQSTGTFVSAHHNAQALKHHAQLGTGNTWLIEAPKLEGKTTEHGIPTQKEDCPILVVESDAALAFLLQTIFQMSGYPVETVSNISDAQRVLTNTAVRTVIIDALLEGDSPDSPSGLTLCQDIRERFPEMIIICASTLHQREQILKAGADLYLPKPFELVQLLSWVSRLSGTQ